jgi:class 3 adenylate cyclase
MTVLFADIRSFTAISESMTPQENFNFLTAYLERMEPVITHHQGFIDKYIGDAIMALFEQNADDAVKAGIAMLGNLEKYNQDRHKAGYPPIHIGIGINTGELMLGIIGGKNRMDGMVISDAVNLASRMEALTKTYQTPLLISENALHNLLQPEDHCIRMIDHVQVHGKTKSISIYEVFDTDPKHQLTAKIANKELFNQAIKLYSLGNYQPAKTLFQRCLYTAPKDNVVHIYLQRIEQLTSMS